MEINTLYTPSDARMKDDIQPFTDTLIKLRSLPIVSYKRKDNLAYEIGVIAQNLECILPTSTKRATNLLANIMSFCSHKLNSYNLVDITINKKIKIDIKDDTVIGIIVFKENDENRLFTKVTHWNNGKCIAMKWENYDKNDKVYIYGTEIDDFLSIDKSQIGILAAGGVKELDNIVIKQEYEMNQQKKKIENLNDTIDKLLQWAITQGYSP